MLFFIFRPFSWRRRPPVFRYCSTTAWSNACSYPQTFLLEAEAPYVPVLFYHCLKECLLLPSDRPPWGGGPLCSGTVQPIVKQGLFYLQTVLFETKDPFVPVLFCYCLKQILFLPSDPSPWGWGPLCSGTVLPLPEEMLVLTFSLPPWGWGPLCSGTVLPLPEAMPVLTFRHFLRLRHLGSVTVLPLPEAMLVLTFRPSSLRQRVHLCSGTVLPLPEAMLVLNLRPFFLRLRPPMFMHCSNTAWNNACPYLQTPLFATEVPYVQVLFYHCLK